MEPLAVRNASIKRLNQNLYDKLRPRLQKGEAVYLWLYSSGGSENESMDVALMERLRTDNPLCVFVSSGMRDAEGYFEEFADRFGRFGLNRIKLIHCDGAFGKEEARWCTEADLIYLSGGNTFYLLNGLRSSPLWSALRHHVDNGGVLAGTSAGALLMTPCITTASYPPFDRDENTVGLKDWQGLHLVDFEFFPHYDHTIRYQRALSEGSHLAHDPIYAVADGAGICVDGPSVRFFGPIWCFYNGEAFQVA